MHGDPQLTSSLRGPGLCPATGDAPLASRTNLLGVRTGCCCGVPGRCCSAGGGPPTMPTHTRVGCVGCSCPLAPLGLAALPLPAAAAGDAKPTGPGSVPLPTAPPAAARSAPGVASSSGASAPDLLSYTTHLLAPGPCSSRRCRRRSEERSALRAGRWDGMGGGRQGQHGGAAAARGSASWRYRRPLPPTRRYSPVQPVGQHDAVVAQDVVAPLLQAHLHRQAGRWRAGRRAGGGARVR